MSAEMSNQTIINIELIFALPDEQQLLTQQVPVGTTVEQAIVQSGILQKYPQIDLTKNKVGLFSQACKLTDELREGDRIEIYRPLIADPKEARKKKAVKQKESLQKDNPKPS
ncbi:RnfH family protein [Aliikangiella maris]|uniref:RnfH family protein n=2 Tax=Aliikangiella maris TaxID=3162458 RepID=A0ABV2BXE9_9GAMM